MLDMTLGVIVLVCVPLAIIIFGFVTSAKGRKIWKNVNTLGNPDYIHVCERTTVYSTPQRTYGTYASTQSQSTIPAYSQSVPAYNRQSTFVNASGQDIRNGYQQSNTAYNSNTYSNSTTPRPYANTQPRNVTANNIPNHQQNTAYNTATTVKTPSVTQKSQADCDYGRSETGYIPHPESTDTHCATHNAESMGSKWKCSSCGKRNRAEETFCRNCGTNRNAVY